MRDESEGKSGSAARLLVADDEKNMRVALASWLEADGFSVDLAVDGAQAIARLSDRSYDLVLLDVRMPGTGGLAVLEWMRQGGPSIPTVMMSAHGDVKDAVAAMRAGAVDYVLKPFDPEELGMRIRNALGSSRALASEAVSRRARVDEPVSVSRAMKEAFALAEKAAPHQATALVTGESGTGKEVIARFIHGKSGRDGAFVAVNLGALPETLAESELFGHEKGAFTGAESRRTGLFEDARGGTLFLDEVGELSTTMQVKLLRALQERSITRLGSTRPIPVDCRVVAATNRDLEAMVGRGEFREDLYYRLDVVRIRVPPLRDRPEDIPELARRFLARYGAKSGVKEIEQDALASLSGYRFPGNVRELENMVERAVILATGPVLTKDDFPLPSSRGKGEEGMHPLDGTLAEIERRAIERALAAKGGRRAETAEALGISRRTLLNKLNEYGYEDR